jgi:dTDP-4-dehydrorhamnose reductase
MTIDTAVPASLSGQHDAPAILVVGGDGLVGSALAACLASRGRRVLATTRRTECVSAQRPLLDLGMPDAFEIPDGVYRACIVAATTNYGRCETDPDAWRINVETIPRLAARLLEHGLRVSFLSTNTVFGGERPWPAEDDPHAPGIAYATQKSEGEAAIATFADRLGARDRLSVVRLTKVLDPSTAPIPDWLAAWSRGETVQPFSDLVFAPMSIRFVAESLATLAGQDHCGNFHLSGSDNVTYVDLARALASRLGLPPALVGSTTARERGIRIAFAPTFSALGMARTTALSGLRAQGLDAAVEDLAAAIQLLPAAPGVGS